MGYVVLEEIVNYKSWDINVIIFGILFMDFFLILLKYWVFYKFIIDFGWKDFKIIFFDLFVFGEGEYKIMDWICC